MQNCNMHEQAPPEQPVYGRKLSYPPEIDDQLLKWLKAEQANGIIMSSDMLRREALRLIQPYCYEFKASTGWLDKFLGRHKISLQPQPKVEPMDDMPMDSAMPEVSQVASMSNHISTIDTPTMQSSSSSPRNDLLHSQDDDMDDDDDDDESDKKEDSKPANPERLKAFNMFVRLFIDENLDRLVPISKQPKEKIQAIIQSCQRQFPEFGDRARKRIRTYLKSCRRSTRLREPSVKPSKKEEKEVIRNMTHIPASQLNEVNNILAQACQNESEEAAKRQRLDPVDVKPTAFLVKSEKNVHKPIAFKAAEPPKTVVNNTSRTTKDPPAFPSFIPSNVKAPLMKLSQSEVKSMRNLIDGYRQSASFLHRSADELEKLLKQCEAYSDKEKSDECNPTQNENNGSQDDDDDDGHELRVEVDPIPVSSSSTSTSSSKGVSVPEKTLEILGGSSSDLVNCISTNEPPKRSNITATLTSSTNDIDVQRRPPEITAKFVQSRDSLLQPVQEIVAIPLPLHVSDGTQPSSAKRFYPPASSVERIIHLTPSDTRSSPIRRESPVTLYQHLHKQNETPATPYQIHAGQKNSEGAITQYQPIAPHKHTEHPVSPYSTHKQVMIQHATVVTMSSHSPQNTVHHLSPQMRIISHQQQLHHQLQEQQQQQQQQQHHQQQEEQQRQQEQQQQHHMQQQEQRQQQQQQSQQEQQHHQQQEQQQQQRQQQQQQQHLQQQQQQTQQQQQQHQQQQLQQQQQPPPSTPSPQQRQQTFPQTRGSPKLVSHVLSQQNSSPSSPMYSYRQNTSQNRSNCQQTKPSHLHPDGHQYSTVHHQGTLNYDTSPQQVLVSRPQVVHQIISPHGMNYHPVLSSVNSPHSLQDLSRQPPHIQEINHQPILQDIGRQSHSEYQHGHSMIFEDHQSR